MELVPVVLAPGVTLTSGTLLLLAGVDAVDLHTLASGLSGGPGTTLATFDTTMLANGSYILHLDGHRATPACQKSSEIAVTVTGEYKPGRVVVELTDFTVPIAGLPITIGRRYDSLEKDNVGDFGHGWSLIVGHPRLEVSTRTSAVSLTTSRRTPRDLLPDAPAAGPQRSSASFFPVYQAEPGVFGTLTQDGGCPLVQYNPSNPDNPHPCFFAFGFAPSYAPTSSSPTRIRTAPRIGWARAASSSRSRIARGTRSPSSRTASSAAPARASRSYATAQGRITQVDYPAYFGALTPDGAVHLRPRRRSGHREAAAVRSNGPWIFTRTYAGSTACSTSVDPTRQHRLRTSTYYADGRLETDTDALEQRDQLRATTWRRGRPRRRSRTRAS